MTRWDELTEQFDHYPPAEAAARAWRDPGPRHGTWHRRAREDVEVLMPLLARALDRLVLELDVELTELDYLLWDELSARVVPERRRPVPRGSRR